MILQIDYQNSRETGDAANLFFTSMRGQPAAVEMESGRLRNSL